MDEHKTKPAGADVCPSKRKQLDLATVKEQIEDTTGPEYWRSLEELAGSEEFQEMLHREFPKGASEWLDDFSRRGFLKTMGASLALAGLTGCTRMPNTEIVPYVRQPENVVPGRPMFYATAFTLGGYASPILVESHLFRPTKIEGNSQHPASLGGTDIYAQASLLDLYDPDRAQNITYMGDVRSWNAFMEAVRGPMSVQKSMAGGGVRILTQTVSSPTLAAQIRGYLEANPMAKWHVYEPISRDNVYEGAKLAFGEPVETRYDLSKADVIVSLDADFLYAGFPGSARYTRDFAARRNPDANMNRLYVVESTPSSTGMKADHRLPLRADDVANFAGNLHLGLVSAVEGNTKFVSALVKDLQSHKGSSVIIAGDHQPPVVHAFAHWINQELGNVGNTVFYTDPVDANPVNQKESLHALVEDMRAGKVDLLMILGGNPAYDAPAELEFASALKSNAVNLKVFLGTHRNETAELCQWHVPEAHYLESWSDARAYDGTVSIVQPLIEPLYGGKSAHELITILAGQSGMTGHDLVQGYWRKQHTGADFEAFWRKSLHDGWIAGTAYAPKGVTLKGFRGSTEPSQTMATITSASNANGTELNFRRDPSIYDGRFSNNGWLQELPKPLTKLTWDNPIMIGPALAERLKLDFKDVAELEFSGKKVKGPIWIQAGHPDNSITVFVGYGRTRAGRVGTGNGFDVYPLRTSQAAWFANGAKLTATGETYNLASTQGYQSMETPDGSERPLVQERSLEEYKKEPNFAKEGEPKPELTLYPGFDYSKETYSWGMAIDLNSCVGCNNCIVACQSENNIAVVGKEQTLKGRHMHWLRVDAYYNGPRDNPKGFFQPVPCMQCENAPCELVCPVQATTHSSEGLNDMVYNRCVGTRYCSNNCPYKVRRFNFLLFQDWETPQFKLMRNPDVTVRSRGVMEKCTYCVQRINERRIDAERADTTIKEGDLQTACQQSCPANAIVFGNLNDPNSQVNKWKAQARNYSLLGELNTRPRTTYLAEVRNPNPKLETKSEATLERSQVLGLRSQETEDRNLTPGT
ncbi:MAG: TAT-variant-translocated molybdopterin oxidoreductase [Acidobacteriia bacterium]|nr:TAT-variant-translocated molybdopterin oxidoreductase [Terriglobia bacterium]